MPLFRIKQAAVEGFSSPMWVPDHPELENLANHPIDGTAYETVRSILHARIDPAFPGVYWLTPTLAEAKADKVAEINAKTAAIIAAGFPYQGQRYPLTVQAVQHNMWMPSLTLGSNIVFSNIDDTVQTSFDSFTIGNFIATGRAFFNSTILSGTTLKKKVLDATTVAAVQAIQDTRTP